MKYVIRGLFHAFFVSLFQARITQLSYSLFCVRLFSLVPLGPFCVPLFSLVPLGPFVFLYFPWSHSGLLCSPFFPGPTRAFCVPLFPPGPTRAFCVPLFPPGPTRAKQGRERYGSGLMLFLLRQVTNSTYFGAGLEINQVCQIPFAKIVLEWAFEASLVLRKIDRNGGRETERGGMGGVGGWGEGSKDWEGRGGKRRRSRDRARRAR